mgnify:CR=1 FL=1
MAIYQSRQSNIVNVNIHLSLPPLETEIGMHGEHEGDQNPAGTDIKRCRGYQTMPS